MKEFSPQKPQVKLISYTPYAYDLSVASARTCYSPTVVEPKEVTDGQRARIGEAIFQAGHHTPFQHATFVFGISGVSRQCVWSFLHSHPFYNSDQTSQRYVVMDKIAVYVPGMPEPALAIYKDAVSKAWSAYERISELLKEDNYKLMSGIGRIKGQDEKNIRIDSEKKAIENGRYVLPICASTSLYHTVSGLVLKRYIRMAAACDCPSEVRELVSAMVTEVKKVDPNFIERIAVNGIADSQTLEAKFSHDADPGASFDIDLGGKNSKLISYDKNAEEIVAESVRIATGSTKSTDDILDEILNPAKNPYLLDTLNNWAYSPVMRSLNNINYTFKKRLSHTADSQDQRHRMTPACRPMLSKVHTLRPDYYTPSAIEKNSEVSALYKETMDMLWDAKNQLIDMGVSASDACYLLPNAVNIRFIQNGSFLNFMHKWRLRLCFNAQLEIYEASRDEFDAVASVHPRLAKHIGPPCFNRKSREQKADGRKEGPCPEGPRWCGITVWQGWPKVKRPF